VVEAGLDSTSGGRREFLTTQWSLVTAATGETAEARTALEQLYRIYCYPVYAFVRRRGYSREDAQDLTQDFFVYLLKKGLFNRADRQRGRFRSFLLGALNYFLAHALERAQARKRGGDLHWVFLDQETAEGHYQLVSPHQLTADQIYEMRWAAALIESAFARLRAELESTGKGYLFETLQKFLLGEQDTSYQQAAKALGLRLGALKTTIHRLRARYRILLREEVARTVASPDQVDEELRQLQAALRG
jgi:RNA polymerase sigma factor (sigma-70 family)